MNADVKDNKATILKEGDVAISDVKTFPILYKVDKVHEDKTMDVTCVEWDGKTWRYGYSYRDVTMDNLRKI